MDKLWYYTVNGREQRGPISEDELRARFQAGEIAPTELAWTEGMADWEPLSSRPDLRTPPKAEAPPLPEPSAQAPAFRSPPNLMAAAPVPAFGGWLTLVGITNIILGVLTVLTCFGLPVGILLIIAGSSALGAKTALDNIRTTSPELAAVLAKFKTYFALMGVIVLLNILGLLFMLINLSGMALAFSRAFESFK
ncbi:MAG TPA: DUF5362 family protein [Kiritimatiellia bacterium]|nr:DUF5362 family protein [Kiritimatiellia bacterium]